MPCVASSEELVYIQQIRPCTYYFVISLFLSKPQGLSISSTA